MSEGFGGSIVQIIMKKFLFLFLILFSLVAISSVSLASAPVLSAGANPPTFNVSGTGGYYWAVFDHDTGLKFAGANDSFYYASMSDAHYQFWSVEGADIAYAGCRNGGSTETSCNSTSPAISYKIDFWIISGVYSATSGSSSPTVDTPVSSAVTSSTATIGATVSSDGGVTITDRSMCYDVTASPTACTTVSGTTGAFTLDITGLSAGVTYFYRGKATNSVGTSYSSDGTFSSEDILGCMDENASNYDSTATADGDPSLCEYIGCMNALAVNYDSSATSDTSPSSCYFSMLVTFDPTFSWLLQFMSLFFIFSGVLGLVYTITRKLL